MESEGLMFSVEPMAVLLPTGLALLAAIAHQVWTGRRMLRGGGRRFARIHSLIGYGLLGLAILHGVVGIIDFLSGA